MNWILAFLPDEALVLVIVAIGFALMLRIINGRTAVSLLGGLVLLILLSPFVEALIGALPWWLTLLLVAGLLLSLLRAVSNLFIGPGATDEMVGTLAADVVRFSFRTFIQLLFLPFRMIGWLFRRGY